MQVALKVADDAMLPLLPQAPKALTDLLAAAFDPDPPRRPSFALIAAVVRQVIEQQQKIEREAITGGVMGAWQRWIK